MRTMLVFWGGWMLTLSWLAFRAPVFATPANVSAVAPTPAEVEIGRRAARDLQDRYGVWNDKAANARMTRIGEMMAHAAHCQASCQFRILDADEPNGISLPGGFIFVTRGLLKLLPEDDLLAAALGHEVAHIALGHMTEMLREQSQGVAPTAGSNAPARSGGPRPEPPAHLREKSADRADARYLQSLQIDPKNLVALLERLSKQPELNADNSLTHPTWRDRIASLQAYLASAQFQQDTDAKAPIAPAQRTAAAPAY